MLKTTQTKQKKITKFTLHLNLGCLCLESEYSELCAPQEKSLYQKFNQNQAIILNLATFIIQNLLLKHTLGHKVRL